jgi:hypothetical protein
MSNQATTDHGKAASSKGAPTAGASATSQKALDDRFTEVGADRFMFNPNKGCTGKLTGYLLNKIEMPEIERAGQTQEWECFLILTTAPCKGIDREKNVVDVPVGSEVLIPGTFKVEDAFAKAAVSASGCYEVQIVPLHKSDIGKGQTMWLYKMGYDKKSLKPRAEFGPAAALSAPAAVKALTAATAESAGASGEDIPF